MAIHQVTHSPRAESILEYNIDLTLLHCNYNFCRLFETQTQEELEQLSLVSKNVFLSKNREEWLLEINEALKISDEYVTEAQIKMVSKKNKWFSFQFQKRRLDNEKTVIMCYVKCIDEYKQTEIELDRLSKYFDAIEKLSGESLYIIDLKNMTLKQSGNIAKELGITEELENFPESVYSYVHEENLEEFKKFTQNSLSGEQSSIKMRVKIISGEYNWYELNSVPIYNKNGDIVEILGKMNNINDEQRLREEYSVTNQYFDAMQELSDDIVYRVSMKQDLTLKYNIGMKTLRQSEEDVENYPNVFVKEETVHPDDSKKYLEYVEQRKMGNNIEGIFRFKFLNSTEYQWYKIKDKEIYDKNGNLQEVWGKMINVNCEQNLKYECRNLNQYIDDMQELSDDILYRVDIKENILHHNIKSAQTKKTGNDIKDYVEVMIREKIVHPDDEEIYRNYVKYRDTESEIIARFAFITEEYEWYKIKNKKIYNEKGELVEVLGKLENINDEMIIREEYTAINQYFSAMQKLSDDIIFHIDVKSKTMFHNDDNAQTFGVPKKIPNFIETFIENKLIPEEDIQSYREYAEKLLTGENMDYEIRAAVDIGVYEWFCVKSTFIYNKKGEPTEIFGRMKNIQKTKDLEQKATHDSLTKAMNKVSFEEKASNYICKASLDKKHALVFIDIDDFKTVNDSYGHHFGDFILENFAKRINNCIREEDLLGRVGGDEFAVYLKGVSNEEMALERVNSMIERMIKPISNSEYSHKIGISIGVALISNPNDTYEKALRRADKAVYNAKKTGKNKASIYTGDLD